MLSYNRFLGVILTKDINTHIINNKLLLKKQFLFEIPKVVDNSRIILYNRFN